jgi:hypothetical protein
MTQETLSQNESLGTAKYGLLEVYGRVPSEEEIEWEIKKRKLKMKRGQLPPYNDKILREISELAVEMRNAQKQRNENENT